MDDVKQMYVNVCEAKDKLQHDADATLQSRLQLELDKVTAGLIAQRRHFRHHCETDAIVFWMQGCTETFNPAATSVAKTYRTTFFKV